MSQPVPEICTFECPYAEFPPPETAGICRTMSGVWCLQLVQLVNKNTPCEWKRRSNPPPSRKVKKAARKK